METKKQELTVGDLYRRISVIELDPPFQRGRVWPVKKQQYLIDTILKNWGIPKIYLAVGKGGDGESYLCIDGKQRLVAIFEFMQNKFVSGKYLNTDNAEVGKLYSNLPIASQDRFDKFKIDVEIIKGATDEEIGELFKRLQNGSSLNAAEKLKANGSTLVNFSDNLTRSSFFTKTISLRDTRGSYFAVALQMTLLAVEGEIQSLKYGNLETFLNKYKSFNLKGPQIRNIQEILKITEKIFPKKNPLIFSNRGNIISVFYLLYELSRRTEIKPLEKKIANFLISFYKDISHPKKEKERSLQYQSAIIQSADSVTSIKKRHEILLKAIVDSDKVFEKVFNVNTKESEFRELYQKIERKYGDSGAFRKHLEMTDVKNLIMCGKRKNKEHIIMHVRDSIGHTNKHRKYTDREITKAIEMLKVL